MADRDRETVDPNRYVHVGDSRWIPLTVLREALARDGLRIITEDEARVLATIREIPLTELEAGSKSMCKKTQWFAVYNAELARRAAKKEKM